MTAAHTRLLLRGMVRSAGFVPPDVSGAAGMRRFCRGRSRNLVDPQQAASIGVGVALARTERRSVKEALRKWSDEDLEGYCRLKGMRRKGGSREELERFAENYAADEEMWRRETPEFEAMPQNEKIKLVHRVCCGEGSATYLDPETGYTVFSAYWHLRRGDCCGVKADLEDAKGYTRTHRCRHCPYADDGTLTDKSMIQLKSNVPLIEATREVFETKMEEIRDLIKQQGEDVSDGKVCTKCNGTKVIPCTRCNGLAVVFSPITQTCPQCEFTGKHPCIYCTPWRPKSKRDFYS